MVLYFSGTGNSRYAAKCIASVTGDETVSINAYIKSGTRGTFQSESPYVFVCPAYCWRVPRVVEDFIKNAAFQGSDKAYFILTCGSEAGNAALYADKLCREKGLAFLGLMSVVMPENYIAMFAVPDKKQADAIIQKAAPHILEIAGYIKDRRPLPHHKPTLVDRLKSGVANDVFYPVFVKSKGFYSTSACIGCGKCEEICPLNNIRLTDGRPGWRENCTHWMACISICPVEAIEYKNRSKGKPRHFLTEAP